MNWLLLTFLSILLRAVYGVMTKVLSNGVKVSSYTQAFLLMLFSGLLALAAAPFVGGISLDYNNVNFLAVFFVVFGSVFGNIIYFAAIKHLTSGTAQITFSSVLVFNTLLAVLFTQLKLSPVNVVGLVLLMIAVLSVSSGKIELNKRGILLMLASAFCFAVFQISSSVVSKQIGVIAYLLIAYLVSALVIFLLKFKIIVNDLKQVQGYSTYKVVFLTSLPSLGYFVFSYFAYRAAPEPAKVAILLTSQVVVAVILSYIFLKERQHLIIKLFAGVLVIVSAFLLKS